jgi:hypothetical protein
MIVVSYGGGTNSTAMLVGMHERGERPDAILFADTGGEKPHTYEHIEAMQAWCVKVGFPPIQSVRNPKGTLEQDCLDREALPSVAYGFKSCSDHFKIRPQARFLKDAGIVPTQRLIGFDADEPHRAKPIEGNRYPLIEWGWGRDECVKAIDRAGLPQPGKSACFFCPSSKKHEIIDLRKRYPDLLERALAMEANADLTKIKGLGRDFAWSALVQFSDAQIDMFSESRVEIDCGCYDGESPSQAAETK